MNRIKAERKANVLNKIGRNPMINYVAEQQGDDQWSVSQYYNNKFAGIAL